MAEIKTDRDIVEAQQTRYAFMRDFGHREFLEKAEKCDRFLAGDQWNPQDLAKLKEQRRPALTINKTHSTIATLCGEQIQNRTEVNYRPKNGAPETTAEALNKVWMQISANNQLPWLKSDVFLDGITRSRGYYDVRLGFDDSMRGEVVITQANSKNVLIDPDGVEYDPDSWGDVMTTRWLSLAEIGALYGKDAVEYLKMKGVTENYDHDMISLYRDRFGGDQMRNAEAFDIKKSEVLRRYRLLERQYRQLTTREFFVDLETGDMREVPESWDRNKIAHVASSFGLSVISRMAKRIKWCATVDDLVTFDKWSPYKHFTIVPYFPYLRYGRTIGVVELILGPQELLNKAMSQELHIINTSANSGWKVKAGSLRNMSIEQLQERGAESGIVLELAETDDADKIQPNQVPTGIDRITFKAEEFIKTISNVSDSMQGLDREDVAAKAIAYKQQRSSVNHTKVFDNLERSDYLLARNVLDLIQEFYTEQRIVNITHQDPTRPAETITVNEPSADGTIANDLTIGEYDVTITSAPYRATMEDSQFEQARAMREIGVAIPDTVLIENSRLTRKTELMRQMAGDQESPEAQKARQLQARMQEAEVVKAEAEAREREAETTLKLARAQREMREGTGEVDPAIVKAQLDAEIREREMQHERQLAEQKAELDRWIKEQDLQLRREQMEAEAALRREEMEREFQLKTEQMQREMAIKEAVAIKQAAAAEAQAEAAAKQGAAPAGGKTTNGE